MGRTTGRKRLPKTRPLIQAVSFGLWRSVLRLYRGSLSYGEDCVAKLGPETDTALMRYSGANTIGQQIIRLHGNISYSIKVATQATAVRVLPISVVRTLSSQHLCMVQIFRIIEDGRPGFWSHQANRRLMRFYGLK